MTGFPVSLPLPGERLEQGGEGRGQAQLLPMAAKPNPGSCSSARHGAAIARWGQSPTDACKCPAAPAGALGCSSTAGRDHNPFDRPQSSLQSSRGMGENHSGKTRVRGKPSPAVCVSSRRVPQHPPLIPFLLPSKVLGFIISFLRSPSATAIPLRGALALPSLLCTVGFCCLGFCFAGSIFIDFSHWAAQHIPHLWGSSFAGPTIPHGTGGRTEGQKMHDSFKLLLLSPSRTQVHSKHTKSIPFICFILEKMMCFSN